MLREVNKKYRRRRGPRVMMMRLKMIPMSNPLSLLVAMERGLLRRRHTSNLIPRKAIKPPTSNKAGPLLVLLLNTNKE
jgi:hypothetical protein